MKTRIVTLALGIAWSSLVGRAPRAQAAEARVVTRSDGTQWVAHVEGSSHDEWVLETSDDLTNWTEIPGLGPVLSSRTNAPERVVGGREDARRFLRAKRTDGLYDRTRMRVMRLTFPTSNWATLLTAARTAETNTRVSVLALDNGATHYDVGARYKGNTSFTGFGGGTPTKKSINLTINETNTTADLLGYETVNLNNAYGDETIMREPLYFAVMSRYAPSPVGSLVSLFINDANWGVYSLVQQEDGDLIKEWFPSNDGDRWRAPNVGGAAAQAELARVPPGGGGGGGGGGFGSGASALTYLGADVASYQKNYILKTDHSTNAWERLVHVIDVLNNTPTAEYRAKIEDVFAVDRWLWFLAVENVFADDDSYWNKGADYGFYFEVESGRLHPVEHDGNEAFTATDVQLSPVQGATGTTRPAIAKLLAIPELKQRYLAHMRTVLRESFHPQAMAPLIEQFHSMSVDAIAADPKKGYTMTTYTNDLTALRSFIQQRYAFLTNHAELRPAAPTIAAVRGPEVAPTAADAPVVTASVQGYASEGVDSVWLYYRPKSYGKFTWVQMQDDGAHGDGAAGDGVYGAATTSYPAGTKVRYYVEARSANATKAASFQPARAEQEPLSYRVALSSATNTPVVIHEILADNVAGSTDPQGEYDDWIELRNVTDQAVDLTGRYLTDDANNPRKWAFPDGTQIAAGGYLLVWADEDGKAVEGLHTNFKLAAGGEELYLIDTDAELNRVLDSVTYGEQTPDRSYGRSAEDADVWTFMTPTPGAANQ